MHLSVQSLVYLLWVQIHGLFFYLVGYNTCCPYSDGHSHTWSVGCPLSTLLCPLGESRQVSLEHLFTCWHSSVLPGIPFPGPTLNEHFLQGSWGSVVWSQNEGMGPGFVHCH